MPVHTFVQVAEDECCVCPECSYVVFPESMRGWPEARVIEWVKLRGLPVLDARTVFGSYLVVNEDLIPSSQRLQARIADLLSAARVAGWRPADEEEETQTMPMPVPLEDRREQLAKAYSKTYHVPIERGRAAVLAGHDAPPVPVDPLSARIEALAKATAHEYGLPMDEAIMKTLESDPTLRSAYIKPPAGPTPWGEPTADQLMGQLAVDDVKELMIERKISSSDAVQKLVLYDWLTTTGRAVHGTDEAAEAQERIWQEIVVERFKRRGIMGDPGHSPGR